jgi:hypothetical protein
VQSRVVRQEGCVSASPGMAAEGPDLFKTSGVLVRMKETSLVESLGRKCPMWDEGEGKRIQHFGCFPCARDCVCPMEPS